MSLTKSIKSIIRYIKKSSPWIKLIILCICILLLINLFKRIESRVETFEDNKPKYTIKTKDLYDDFYSEIYDELVYNPKKNEYEISNILKKISLPKKSKILDIGSGTGHHVALFNKNGFNCTGIDKSSSMVEKAKKNYPNYRFYNGDILSSITFTGNSYSMISCFYFTIYYIKEKRQFFQNCMYWLEPGGWLALHLVDRNNFDPIIPAGDPFIMISPQNYAKKRITSSVVKFNNFKYRANFKLDEGKSIGTFKESIKFDKGGKVRENEHTFYMETQKQILSVAKEAGFILKAKIDLTRCLYDNQYLYLLYKPE